MAASWYAEFALLFVVPLLADAHTPQVESSCDRARLFSTRNELAFRIP